MAELKNLSEIEYLVSNGLGGTSSSSAIQLNSRRHHSILSISLNPPVDRRILVSRISEKVYCDEKTYLLSTLKTANGFIEKGYENIVSYNFYGYPSWKFKVGKNLLKKELLMLKNRNIVLIVYENVFGEDLDIEIIPYFNDRDIHSNTLPGQLTLNKTVMKSNYLELKTNFLNTIFLKTNGTLKNFEHTLHNVFYDVENKRGLFAYEEIYSNVKINAHMKKGDKVYIVFSGNESIENINIESEIKKEKERLNSFKINKVKTINKLQIASDTFLSKRKSTEKLTILAGYPWFTDWGRDTMIAIEGLLIENKKFNEAKEVFETFLMNLKNGLIPNVFDDYSGKPGGYNTVDGTLWMFYALYKYYEATNDLEFIKKHYDKLIEIIKYHVNGTDYNIHMTEDGLIYAGNKETQLTWMDVRVENWTVTPRYGKTVEINALWYNTLKIMEFFSSLIKVDFEYDLLSEKVKKTFNDTFWNVEKKCLYDCVNEFEKDSSIRPNQIFAVSLPFSILEKKKEKSIVNKVFEELYTPYGLRTLSPNDPRYIGIYTGDRWTRDGSYHQGNVWPWLLGHFYEAFLKINNYDLESKTIVKELLYPVSIRINDEWGGTIPEILEGNWPHEKRGCFSQAWSVSEILRIMKKIDFTE
ncbi:glycogen debranching protein [Tepiditoga spiralis]|uniref:Glycogen debranching protein n=1 Tax=Tepiditoga spiralis TaxID=2108365 RepID=A0A7G1G8V9_9BACT|nr:amylo-alpha-1,6-glucosidase [Tepiditoga spiralis]BBE31407.1 glycogen debranching protein [Tepiditoga spiralis]